VYFAHDVQRVSLFSYGHVVTIRLRRLELFD
jgi:hypothetical protein